MTTQDLESKLSHRPESPLFARLANEYLAVNRIADAKRICMTGLKRFPQYSTAHLILARCFTTESDYLSALAALEQAQHFLPDGAVLQEFHKTLQTFITSAQSPEETTIKQEIEHPSEEIEQSSQIFEYQLPIIQEGPKIDDTIVEEPAQEIPKEELTLTSTFTEIPSKEFPINSTEETPQDNTILSEHPSEIPDNIPLEPFQDSTQTEVAQTTLETSGDEILPENVPPDVDQIQKATTEDSEALSENIISAAEVVQQEIPAEPRNNISPVSQEPPLVDSQSPQDKNNAEYPNEVRIVSKTLAEIYASQGAYDEAIITYQLLKEYHPERTIECDTRITELEILRQEKIKE